MDMETPEKFEPRKNLEKKVPNQKEIAEKINDDEKMAWWKSVAEKGFTHEPKLDEEKKLKVQSGPEHLEETAKLDSERLKWWNNASSQNTPEKQNSLN